MPPGYAKIPSGKSTILHNCYLTVEACGKLNRPKAGYRLITRSNTALLRDIFRHECLKNKEMCQLQHSLLQLLDFTRRADVHFSFVEKHDVVLVVNLVVSKGMPLDQLQSRKDNPLESLVAAHKGQRRNKLHANII